ncbi:MULTISPECIES: hypothetical protein [Amycolatopsis]|nr:hypothetical protein [Amycolatopsis bullii]
MDELKALATLSFDWADTRDHVWRDSPYHMDGLHTESLAALDTGIHDALGPATRRAQPHRARHMRSERVGKTHLLGLVRRRVHRARGDFFLDDVTAAEAFWENTAEALRRDRSPVADISRLERAQFYVEGYGLSGSVRWRRRCACPPTRPARCG